jgi:folate-dependent phosphoribosylglycinamide formyltransferase PurN
MERTDGGRVFDRERPLRVAALFSGGASGVRHLLAADGDWEVVGAVASTPTAAGVDHLEAAGVDVTVRDLRGFYDERDAPADDRDLRRAFDRGTREHLAGLDPAPDLVVLSGYTWLLTEPLVETVPTLNVHPGDLTVTEGGERVYTGLDPVTDAIRAGDRSTRSTVHFVTTAVDAGPILVRSRPLPVHRDLVEGLAAAPVDTDDAVAAYADAHQEWMKWAADGPALEAALGLVAAGRVERDGDTVRIDGDPALYDLGDGRVRRR